LCGLHELSCQLSPFPFLYGTQIDRYPNTVAALAFSRDGATLAVASSYTHEKGDAAHEGDDIYLRKMQDVEVRPKQRKQ